MDGGRRELRWLFRGRTFSIGHFGTKAIHTLVPNDGTHLWMLKQTNHFLILPGRGGLGVLVKEVAVPGQLFTVNHDHKVQMGPGLREGTLNTFRCPQEIVESHQAAEGSARRTAYNPSGFPLAYQAQSFTAVLHTSKVPGLA